MSTQRSVPLAEAARRYQRLELALGPLSCVSDAQTIGAKLARLPGVRDVLANGLTERAVVLLDPTEGDVGRVFSTLDELRSDATERLVRLHAPAGCACDGCVEWLKRRLMEVHGVEGVVVNADEGAVTVEYVPAQTDGDGLATVLSSSPGGRCDHVLP